MASEAIYKGETNINLKKGGNLGSSGLEVAIKEVVGRDMGGAFPKSAVMGEIRSNEDGGRAREVKLVVKRAYIDVRKNDVFGNEDKGMSMARRYFERWKYLRKIGIPTVSSMRLVDEIRLAMEDMTTDGSEFMGKGKREELCGLEYSDRSRELTTGERLFLEIDPQKIKDEVGRVADLAWDHGITLPDDDPYDLLIHLDGSFEVLVMDITALGKVGKEFSYEEFEQERGSYLREVDITRKKLLKLVERNKIHNERQ